MFFLSYSTYTYNPLSSLLSQSRRPSFFPFTLMTLWPLCVTSWTGRFTPRCCSWSMQNQVSIFKHSRRVSLTTDGPIDSDFTFLWCYFWVYLVCMCGWGLWIRQLPNCLISKITWSGDALRHCAPVLKNITALQCNVEIFDLQPLLPWARQHGQHAHPN